MLSLHCQQRWSFTVWRKIPLSLSLCLFFSLTYIYTQVLSYVGPILTKEHQSSGEVSNTLRSCKGEQGEQAILYGDILYTYILFFKPKKYIFSLIRVSHITIFYSSAASHIYQRQDVKQKLTLQSLSIHIMPDSNEPSTKGQPSKIIMPLSREMSKRLWFITQCSLDIQWQHQQFFLHLRLI